MPKMIKKMIDENFIQVMNEIRHNKKTVEEIIEKMEEFDYLAGDVQGYISNTENEITKLDPRIICLLLECTFEVTNLPKAFPKHYFTDSEIKTSKQFTGDMIRKERIELPLTLHDVSEIGNGMYFTKMNTIAVSDWMNSLLLNYNFDTQREPTIEMFQGQIIFEPTVYPQNIKEMTELMRSREFIPANAIIINAGLRTSESKNGEYIFNKENGTLTITDGSKLDVIDGYHRCRAIQNVMSIDKTINIEFPVIFINFSVKKCQKLLEQMSKATPLSKTRIDEFKDDDFVNDIVQQLKEESELKGKIITSGVRTYDKRYLVAHDIIADGIRDTFKLENKADALDVSDYLCSFFDYLIGSHETEFIDNVIETREKSFINHDFMVGIGFVVLAKRMLDENIKIRRIRNILGKIDFSKDNEEWRKIKLVTKNGEVTELSRAKKIITKYFKEIELEEGVLVD